MKNEIVLENPIDAHVHLREGQMLAQVASFTTKVFSAAVLMGNLLKPVETAEDFKRYHHEVALYHGDDFKPVLGIMLTLQTTPETVEDAYKVGARFIKNIPTGVSTNACGVPMHLLESADLVFKKAMELNMPVLFHCETGLFHSPDTPDPVDSTICYLQHLVKRLPGLKMVIEHVNTAPLANWVRQAPANVKATLTCHHALLTYADLESSWLEGPVLNAFNYCRPRPRFEDDRRTVADAMTSGSNKFFFGSDSAPHYRAAKIKPNPAAGIFTAPVALPLLAEIFEKAGKLENLGSFVSPSWAPEFYGFVAPKPKMVVLKKESWQVPEHYKGIPIFKGGETLNWKIA